MAAASQHAPEDSGASRLEELIGLTLRDLQDVLMQGLLVRTEVTPHHPKTYAGTRQWGETVAALRDKLVPSGWVAEDQSNCPLVKHPGGKLMIVVQTGDRETGTSGIPSNRAPKGSVTEDAVIANYQQLSLFGEQDLAGIDVIPGVVLWVLLYHFAQGELRSELSLPLEMVGGKIKSWKERIVFPAIRLDGSDSNLGDDDDSDDGFEVPVTKRPG